MKIKILTLCFVILGIFMLFTKNYDIAKNKKVYISPYPYGKNFAFTITDDPDGNRLEIIKPVYDFLKQVGIKTTPALWVFNPTRTNGIPDFDLVEHPKKKESWQRDTCERKAYLSYMLDLQRNGFEIAMHGASTGNDYRNVTIKGYEKFKEYFGNYPKINIMHAQNLENLYWGKKVVSDQIVRSLIGTLISKANIPFSGEIENSEYFWGDIAKKNTKYVRLFGTDDINTLKFNPSMPYHDPKKPFVNYWFSFSDGSIPKRFNEMLTSKNVDKLEKERGTCIVYTHFAHGFVKNNILNEKFIERINSLVKREQGWFVPCSTILDRLLLIKKIYIKLNKKKILVMNYNDTDIEGLTILTEPNKIYRDLNGISYIANDEGEVIIKKIEKLNGLLLIEEPLYNYEIKSETEFYKFDDVIYINKIKSKNKSNKLVQIIGNGNYTRITGEIISDLNISNEACLPIILTENYLNYNKPNENVGIIEKYNLILERILLYLKHNEGYMAFLSNK